VSGLFWLHDCLKEKKIPTGNLTGASGWDLEAFEIESDSSPFANSVD